MRFLSVAVTLAALGSLAGAQTLGVGCDCYITDPPPAGDSTIEIPALPAGFFGLDAGAPSDPTPVQVIEVQGLKLPDATLALLCPNAAVFETQWFDPHGTPVAPNDEHRVTSSEVFTGFQPIDTIVCRTAPAVLPPIGGAVVVPIEVTELSLVSVAPILVTYGGGATNQLWNVFVTEAGVVPGGQVTLQTTGILPNSVNGNLTLGNMPVQYELNFVEVTGTIASPGPLPGNLTFTDPSTGDWQYFLTSVPLFNNWAIGVLIAIFGCVGFYIVRKRKLALS